MRLPKKRGKLDIFPEYIGRGVTGVTIIGTPGGLRYLAKLLNQLADYEQNQSDAPKGTREHFHLHPEGQLGAHSCEVELCRADAKETGELPGFMTH